MTGVLGLLVASYLILIGTTVYNTLQRQRAEKQIAQVTGELSEMEFSYLNLKAKVNPELARSLGFVDVESVIVAKSVPGATAYVSKKDM